MYLLNVFLLSFTWFQLMEASVYPAVAWDPLNPLFGCEDPKINIRIGDSVNFLCPSEEFNFFVPSSHVILTHENLYYLGNNKDQYEACNATGMKRILYCDGIKSNLYTISFRDIQTSVNALYFTKGETYYFIGTGFRVKAKLDQIVNGSCKAIDKEGEHKLRLKLYVCKDDEVCDICKTNGCYYKDCSNLTCTQWKSDGKIYKNSSKLCSEFQKRTCKNNLLGYNDDQVRNNLVACPPEKINCSIWFSSGNLHYDTKSLTCFSVNIRTCKDGFTGDEFNETRNIYNTCPVNLPLCSNWTTNVFSQKCIKLTTRKCQTPLAGVFNESDYIEVQCPLNLETTSMVVPINYIVSTISTSLNNDTGTTMTMQVNDIANINPTSFHIESTTMVSIRASVIPTSSHIVNINAINDTTQFLYLQNCTDQKSTVTSLIAALAIVFLCLCIVLCYCVFMWWNQNKKVKVHPDKNRNLTFKVLECSQEVDKNWRLACVDDIHTVVNEKRNSASTQQIKDILSGKNLHSCALENGRIYILSCNCRDTIGVYKGDDHKLVVSTVYNDIPEANYINKGFSPDIALP